MKRSQQYAAPLRRPSGSGMSHPIFEARGTIGPAAFSAFRKRWLVLFSHPADFTPVCTTPPSSFALAHEAAAFEARDCTLMAPFRRQALFSHFALGCAWIRDSASGGGSALSRFVEDSDAGDRSCLLVMSPRRTATGATVRTTFFIDPDGVYPGNDLLTPLPILAARFRKCCGFSTGCRQSMPRVRLRLPTAAGRTDAESRPRMTSTRSTRPRTSQAGSCAIPKAGGGVRA